MAAGLTDGLASRIGFRSDDRRLLLTAALAAGFGSVFGVPWLIAVIACLMRWMYAPQQRRYLYLAMFLYGFVPPIKGNGPVMNGIGLSAVIAVMVAQAKYRPAARAAGLRAGRLALAGGPGRTGAPTLGQLPPLERCRLERLACLLLRHRRIHCMRKRTRRNVTGLNVLTRTLRTHKQ